MSETTSAYDLETLWHEHHLRVRYYILKRMRNEWITDEFVAIVYYRAAVATANGNGARENAGAWLFQIARSVIWDHFRYYRDITVVDYDALADRPEESIPLWQQLHRAEVAEQVRHAVDQLTLAQSEVVEMRLEGMTVPEIAASKGYNLDQTKALKARAYAALRERLTELLQEAA